MGKRYSKEFKIAFVREARAHMEKGGNFSEFSRKHRGVSTSSLTNWQREYSKELANFSGPTLAELSTTIVPKSAVVVKEAKEPTKTVHDKRAILLACAPKDVPDMLRALKEAGL